MSEALPNNTYAPIIHNGLGIITGNAVAHSLQRNNYSISATTINNKARDSIYTKSGGDQFIVSTGGDILTQASSGNVTIEAGANSAGAIYLFASNLANGGITLESGNGGITMDTSGNITINSTGNGDISFGGSNTANITITANLNVDINADDFNVTVDNNINLISEFGEIILSSNSGEPNQCVTLDNGGNLIIGTNEGAVFGYKTELALTSEANTAPGRNGMVVYSTDADISPEFRVNYSNPDGSREVSMTMGVYSENSVAAVYQKYSAYPHGELIIRLSGPEFTYNDVGRQLIFETSGQTCNITNIGTVILPPIALSDSYPVTLTAGGIYSGSNDATFIVQIDSEDESSAGRPSDTFRWSVDGGATWAETFVPVSYALDTRYPLVIRSDVATIATGVYISFSSATLGSVADSWTIYAKITAIVNHEFTPIGAGSNTVTITQGNVFDGVDPVTNQPIIITDTEEGSPVLETLSDNERIQLTQTVVALGPYTGFVGTDTNSDFILKTGGTERMRVTADGSLCVGSEGSDARLQLVSNFNKPMLVNDNLLNLASPTSSPGILGNQQNPASTEINTGGYVIVYESSDPVSPYNTRIYGNYFTANGDKLGESFEISNTAVDPYNHFQPHVAKSYDKQSDKYIVVWTKQDLDNDSSYSIMFKAYNNGNHVYANDTALTKPDGVTVCLNPRVASYADGYIIVYHAAIDNTKTATYKLYYNTVSVDFASSAPVEILTADPTKNHVYPYVCGLSLVDIAAPGGFVVTYLAQVYSTDPRYQIKYRAYYSNLEVASAESNVTTTGIFNSQTDQDLYLSDGLPTCAPIPDNIAKISGGFAIAYSTNYTAAFDYNSLPAGSVNVVGLSSQAFGRIQNATVSSNIVTLNVSNVYLDFIQGEKLQIVAPDGFVIEKAALVTTTTTPSNTQVEHWSNITLSTDPKEIRLKYYDTTNMVGNPAASGTQIFDSVLNSGDLVIDSTRATLPTDAANVSPINFTRFNQPNFYAYRTLTHVKTNDTNECLVAWESGSTPHIYSQRVSVPFGGLVGTERLYSQNALGQRQTDPFVSTLVNSQGGVLGYSVAFGQDAVDLSYTAVQQELVGSYSYLLHINNQTAEFVVSNDGQLGLNTTQPSATLHVAALPSANPVDPQTVSMILQTPSTNIDTINDKHQIRFSDGNGSELARIKVKYSDYYQDLNPQADALISYFKFDESTGALAAVNSSAYNIQSNTFTDLANVNTGLINNRSQAGTLIGFNPETCWATGKINNGLVFNGYAANNYVKIQRAGDVTAPYPETIPSMGDGSFAVSTWLKTVGTPFSDSNMAIVSIGSAPVGGNADFSGAFQLLLRNDVAVGGSNLFPVLRMSNGAITDIYSSANTVGDQEWHHVVWDYYHSATSNLANIWIDGVLVESESLSPGCNVTIADNNASFKDVYIGSNVAGNGLFYNGVLDELRFYKTHLSNSDINRLYTYGNEQRASLIIQTLGTNSTFSDTGAGLVLDDTGSLLGTQFRNNTSRILSGALYIKTVGDNTVYGLDTQFLGEVNQGDNLLLTNEITAPEDIINNLYQVVSISNNTVMTIDRAVPSASTSNTTFDNVTIYPGIISAKDENSDLKMTMNHFGDLIIGNRRSTTNPTRLEIRGSGDAENKNGLTLHNTNTSPVSVPGVDISGSRANKIYFKTANTASQADVLQAMVKTSLSNAGAYASKMEFFVNKNTTDDVITDDGLTKQFTLANNSVLIGDASLASGIIPGQLTVQSSNTDPLTLTYVNRQPSITSVFGSSIDTLYYNEQTTANQDNPMVRVQVSHDYPTGTLTSSKTYGRMDFYITNENTTLARTAFTNGDNIADPQSLSRLCITSNGLVGVHSQRPTGVFQVSPRYVDTQDGVFTANITAAVSGNITVETDIYTDAIQHLIRGGSMVVYDGSNLVAYPLTTTTDPIYQTGVGTTCNIQLAPSVLPVGVNYTGNAYSLHYPGMLVNKYGLVGIGNTAFGDTNLDYHLDVSGNTAIKGVLSFGSNISSSVSPSTAPGFRTSADGSNLEVQATTNGGFTPIGDLISATSGFRINPTTSNIDLKDITTGGVYTPLEQYINDTSGFRINPTTSNIDLKDITTGGVYFGLQNYVSRRAIKEITNNPYAVDLSTDYTILSNIPGVGPNNINLPATFTSEYEGKIIVIKNINTNSVIVNGWIDSTSGNTITLTQNQSITLQAATISSTNQYFIIG